MNRSRKQWVCGVTAALLAFAANADPPAFKHNNRTYGNFVDGGSCTDLENRQFCRSIHVWENYDVKGTFEFTEASLVTWSFRYDPGDESYERTWRVLSCPVDQSSIDAHRNRVTVDVTLDTDGPGCYQWGERHTWDPIHGDQWFPYFYQTGTYAFEGEWMAPFNHGSSKWQQHNTHYDGWSDTTNRNVSHCQSRWGEFMTRGGFTTTSYSGWVRTYNFEGPDGSAWSAYNVSSCNDKNVQK